MLSLFGAAAFTLLGLAAAQNTQTGTSAVYAAQATASSSSPSSNIKGAAFDRFVNIWLENTDFTMAMADPNLQALAAKGITLTNYFGVTHPSEPNYVAAIGGDNFGMDNDAFNSVTGNVSSIVDLLEAKGISWGFYQEDMPYSGFEGMAWVNQQTKANDYVRKHNPGVIYAANNRTDRLSYMKNLTMFQSDLAANTLPQWMFITPNMTSDGHDTSVTTAGTWTAKFMAPLLNNSNFMKNTLVFITFDENHSYTQQNRVMGILIGDAVPAALVGSTDANFYNHYSEISTVEANWNLPTLGRWDVGANVFSMVAAKTGDVVRPWAAATGADATAFFNSSFAGPFNSVNSSVPYPAPNVMLSQNGRHVLPSIVGQWFTASQSQGTYYNNTVQIPDGLRLPTYMPKLSFKKR